MSTKIYDAYRYKGSLDELLADLKEVRREYTEHVRSVLKEKLKTVDRQELEEVLIKDMTVMMPMWSNELAFNGSVVVYPYKKMLLLQTFSIADFGRGKSPVFSSWIKSGKLVDFHYQNQVDLWFDDEKMNRFRKYFAERNWNFRKKVWDEIFSIDWSPRMAGFSFEMISAFEASCMLNRIHNEPAGKESKR